MTVLPGSKKPAEKGMEAVTYHIGHDREIQARARQDRTECSFFTPAFPAPPHSQDLSAPTAVSPAIEPTSGPEKRSQTYPAPEQVGAKEK